MCQFFSVVSKGDGIPIYCDDVVRKSGDIGEPDSHTAIADYFGIKGLAQDRLNKYEYNPLTKKFTVDQLNTDDDSVRMEKFCKELNFKRIVPELIIKPIVHPFKDRNAKRVTKKDIALLVKWDSVRDSVGDSVRYSVRDSMWGSVWDSVGVSVWDSMWGSVGDSVWDSVWYSVWDSVSDSVRDSVRDSARDSVGAYIGSFFDIDYKINLTSSNKLWDKGLVPSFDGALWRLHGKNGKIIYTITQEKLRAMK